MGQETVAKNAYATSVRRRARQWQGTIVQKGHDNEYKQKKIKPEEGEEGEKSSGQYDVGKDNRCRSKTDDEKKIIQNDSQKN